MKELVEIHWTTGSLDEARRVCRYLVQERLVACSQIIPWIESVFLWNGQLETAQESKVVFKTLEKHFDTIVKVINDNTSYDVPEITMLSVKNCNPGYQNWVIEMCDSTNDMTQSV